MTVIKLSSESTGMYETQEREDGYIPNGFAVLPQTDEVKTLYPWIKPIETVTETYDIGKEIIVVMEIADNAEARAAYEAQNTAKPSVPDSITQIQLALADIAEQQAADQTANQLALAELAELITGGES